jgi:hypothetical protein
MKRLYLTLIVLILTVSGNERILAGNAAFNGLKVGENNDP